MDAFVYFHRLTWYNCETTIQLCYPHLHDAIRHHKPVSAAKKKSLDAVRRRPIVTPTR